MPPKIKITKETIIHAALQLVRTHGMDAINARDLAKAMGCSTQPIFSNFDSIQDLKMAVVQAANELYITHSDNEINRGTYPAYKASGMAYISFAKTQPRLFHLLFMRDRSSESVAYQESTFDQQIANLVQECTGLDTPTSQLFHLEMWAVVHGIATMCATGYYDLDDQLISRMLTDAYQGARLRFNLPT